MKRSVSSEKEEPLAEELSDRHPEALLITSKTLAENVLAMANDLGYPNRFLAGTRRRSVIIAWKPPGASVKSTTGRF
jgi:hypothetical protein